MAEVAHFVLGTAVRLLVILATQAQVGKAFLDVIQRRLAERVMHAYHELALQPAAGVVVAVELVDFFHCLVSAVHQAQQFQVAGQDVAVFLQLAADEVQAVAPEAATWRIQQHHRYQRALAGLDQGQHLQRFIQSAETTRAQHQGIGLLDEEQLADEEEMERQQLVGAVHRGVGVLFEGQGDVEPQAVVAAGAFVGSCHDAAASTGDDHQVGARQGCAQLAGQGVHRVLQRSARRAEHGHLAPALVAFQGAERMVQFAQGLQGDLRAPAVGVVMGHAQDGQHHVAVQRQVGAVRCHQLQLCVDVAQVDVVVAEVAEQQFTRLVRHATSPSAPIPLTSI
ncbi:hypothetical protein D3C72_600470 [compost metagenome]